MIRGKAVRNGTLDRSDVKNVKRSADDSGKWTPFLLFRVQLQDTREILHSAKDLGVGIASRMLIHPCKTILYSISAVFTHPQESQ